MKEKKRMGVKKRLKRSYTKPALISIDSLNRTHESSDANIRHTAEVIPEYIKKNMKYGETDVLQINVKYSQIKHKDSRERHDKAVNAIKKINKFYDGAAEHFVKFSERVLYKNAVSDYLNSMRETDSGGHTGFKPFGAVFSFEVTYNKSDFLCIYFDANIYSGKGRGNITRRSHIWNLTDGSIIPSDRFENFSVDNKKKICSRICEIMRSQSERGEEYYINTDFKTVYRHFDRRNMFITERGCNFFFPQNTLSPAECGIVSFLYTQ